MKSPAFQFYTKDYLGSQRVQMMTLEEEGAYIRLMAYCWQHGDIPACPEKAARLIGKGASTTLATNVLTMFQAIDGTDRMNHDRLETERVKQAEWREKSSQGGKKSAESRKQKATTLEPPLEGCLPNGSNQKPTLHLQSSSSSTKDSSKEESLLSDKPDDYPEIIKNLWSIFPAKSRDRSSKAKLAQEWRKLKAKPDEQTITDSLTKWASCHEWTKDGGQFAPGAHLWLKDRKWESEPISGNAQNQFRGTNEALSLKIL
jgi:uncharacterized protein YdaU (DUF1376 family)